MNERKKLYLHIGVHRTATTAIQATMRANWKRLRNQGFLYPFGVERHIGTFNNIFFGHKTTGEVCDLLLQRVAAQDGDIHSIILSDEDVSMRHDLGLLREFTRHFDVKVIFAMRRQDLWLESWWAQNVKGQWDRRFCHMPWPEFMASRAHFHWIDYDRYIHHIEDVFGEGSVLPYVFERGQMPEGPIAEFCKQFGFEDYRKLKKAGGENISLTPEVSEFVRHLPFIEAPMKLRLELISMAEVVDRQIRARNATTLMIPHDERRQIMAEYAPGNRHVAQRFFGRDDLFFDPLPDASVPVVTPALPGDSTQTMQRLVTPFMEEMVRRLRDK
ncbi:MAG: hypothetical protein L0G27_05965 [Paracoccus sp. (in: a-proteobacteria)]|nr:hypothetical protein [Paracoccus sp. (in: a-proteobacteria)]